MAITHGVESCIAFSQAQRQQICRLLSTKSEVMTPSKLLTSLVDLKRRTEVEATRWRRKKRATGPLRKMRKVVRKKLRKMKERLNESPVGKEGRKKIIRTTTNRMGIGSSKSMKGKR